MKQEVQVKTSEIKTGGGTTKQRNSSELLMTKIQNDSLMNSKKFIVQNSTLRMEVRSLQIVTAF